MIILIFKISGIMLLDVTCNVIFEISISWSLQLKSLLISKNKKLNCFVIMTLIHILAQLSGNKKVILSLCKLCFKMLLEY